VNPVGPRIVNRDPLRSPSLSAAPWEPLPRIFQRLPADAAEIMAGLIQQSDEARAAWRVQQDKIESTRTKRETAKIVVMS